MGQKNKTELKELFENGDKPDQNDYEDLIDSNFNLNENDANNIQTDQSGETVQEKLDNNTSGISSNAGNISNNTILINNNSNAITTSGVDKIKETRDDDALSFWSGSQAQYDAIGTPDSNTIYFVV